MIYRTIVIISILILQLNATEIKTRTGEFPQKQLKAQNTTIASLVAKEIAKTLPQKVDKYTILKNVTSKGSTIIYTFEINTPSKSDDAIKKEDKSRMQQAITKGVCQSSRKFLQAGINTSYIYKSARSKNELFRFHISEKDCNFKID